MSLREIEELLLERGAAPDSIIGRTHTALDKKIPDNAFFAQEQIQKAA